MAFKKIVAVVLLLCIAGLAACKKTTPDAVSNTHPSIQKTVRVTIPEGYTVCQIAQLLEEKKVCTKAAFLTAVNAPPKENGFAQSITNSTKRAFLMEGYVFPDTYDFYVNEAADNALNRFLNNMKTKLTAEDYSRAKELGFSMDEIMIMASLIQEEAGPEEQMKMVSSVIHNRLNNKKYPTLDLDSTINYIEHHVKPNISGDKNRYNALYNTYKCKGLPTGPICNPGRQAIKAALYPKKSEYYFFVAKDGKYYYAKTSAEHSKNVIKAKIIMPK